MPRDRIPNPILFVIAELKSNRAPLLYYNSIGAFSSPPKINEDGAHSVPLFRLV